MDAQSIDTLLNDQVQNALAFYAAYANKPAVPTTDQLIAQPVYVANPILDSTGLATGNTGTDTVLVIGLAVLAVFVLMKVLK